MRTQQVIAFHVGDRSRKSAKKLWNNIPEVYCQRATFYTDLYDGYDGVIPQVQHQAISKKVRKTNHVERFNCNLTAADIASGKRNIIILQET